MVSQKPKDLRDVVLQLLTIRTTHRDRRRFIEAHPELLDPHSESILSALITQYSEQQEREKERDIRNLLSLLRNARQRGGTMTAIREAYINAHGGLTLDLPSWLEAIDNQLSELLRQGRLDQTAATRVVILRNALKCAQSDSEIAPEIHAELQSELALALIEDPLAARAQALEEIIRINEAALQVYTFYHYPRKYAMVQNNLGKAYTHRIKGTKRRNLEQAIGCYLATLQVYTLTDFPVEYAMIQHNLGTVYGDRIAGNRRDNLEQSIAHFSAALAIRTLVDFPIQYAMTQNCLGGVYLHQVTGSRRDNVDQAIACFNAALQVYSLADFPIQYAMVQNNLGSAFRNRMMGDRRDNLEAAIACFSRALQIYTLTDFPTEYAALQNTLGNTYGDRIAALPHQNLTPNCSIASGQEIPRHAAESGEGNGPRITSSCHCSSCVSNRKARILRMPR